MVVVMHCAAGFFLVAISDMMAPKVKLAIPKVMTPWPESTAKLFFFQVLLPVYSSHPTLYPRVRVSPLFHPPPHESGQTALNHGCVHWHSLTFRFAHSLLYVCTTGCVEASSAVISDTSSHYALRSTVKVRPRCVVSVALCLTDKSWPYPGLS